MTNVVEQMVEFLEGAIEQEVQNYEDGVYEDFRHGENADSDPVIHVLREAVDELWDLSEAGHLPAKQWVEELGTKLYEATMTEGVIYGDTDFVDDITDELLAILG